MIRNILQIFVDDLPANIAILIIFFGTSLFNYTVFEPCMSHPNSFFLYALVVYYLVKLCRQSKIQHAALLGLFLGLSFITRNTAILLFIFPGIFYLLNTSLPFTLKNKLINFSILFLFFIIGILPQIIYIYLVTGKPWVNTYSGYAFYFNNPQIINGLFSFRKGLFVYTPVILFPLIGIYYCLKNKFYKLYGIAICLYLTLFTYITFAWGMWFYGWGFGCRPFIEIFALLCIPLGFVLQKILSLKKLHRVSLLILLLLCLTLNVFQSWQYRLNILHGTNTNTKYYWRVFGRTKITDEDRALIDQKMTMNDGGW